MTHDQNSGIERHGTRLYITNARIAHRRVYIFLVNSFFEHADAGLDRDVRGPAPPVEASSTRPSDSCKVYSTEYSDAH